MSENATPLYVVKALASVREGGRVSMGERDTVRDLVYLNGAPRAAEWLDKASDSQYMDALNDMGEYISAPESTPPDDNDTPGYDDEETYFDLA